MERYRSGHNEAVLKTVCPQGRVGSNPTLSAHKIKSAVDFHGTFDLDKVEERGTLGVLQFRELLLQEVFLLFYQDFDVVSVLTGCCREAEKYV